MSGKEYVSIESLRLQAELLVADYLVENQIITESEYKVGFLGSSSFDLLESVSRQDSPAYWYGDIHYNDFKLVWNNIKDYPKTISVWRMFHPKADMTDMEKATNAANAWARRILRKFLKDLQQANIELVAKSADERNRLVAHYDRTGEIDPEEFPIDTSIDTGRHRRGSQTGNLERASQFYAGELYNDESRIPLRRWGSWWKRYVSARTSVDTGSSAFSIAKWTRHFILGYAIDKNIVFEIWYSSHDGTFSVHDRYGNPVRRGDGIPLMRDALNLLFHNIAEYSPEDASIIKSSGPDLRRVNQDLARMLAGTVSAADDYAARMTDRKERIKNARLRAKIEAEAKKGQADIAAEQKEREREQKRAEKDRKDNKSGFEKFADGVKGAAMAAKAAYKYAKKAKERMSEFRAKMAKAKAKSDHLKRMKAIQMDSLGVAVPNDFKRRESEIDKRMEAVEKEYEKAARAPEPQTKEEMEALDSILKRVDEMLKSTDRLIADQEKSAKQILDELEDEGRRMTSEVQHSKAQQQLFDRRIRELNRRDRDRSKSPTLEDKFPELHVDVGNKAKPKPKKKVNIKKNNRKKTVNESILDQLDSVDVSRSGVDRDLSDYAQNPLYQEKTNSEVERIRKSSEDSPYTRQVINAMFLDGFVRTYHETRVRRRNVFVRVLERFFRLFRGRPQPIVLPTKVASRRQRIRGFFAGTQARADFIIGYTIDDKVNYEIWYVQELSADAKRQIASFYLYDVTAEKVIEGNLPHYRNAIHALLMKIGVDGEVAKRV